MFKTFGCHFDFVSCVICLMNNGCYVHVTTHSGVKEIHLSLNVQSVSLLTF